MKPVSVKWIIHSTGGRFFGDPALLDTLIPNIVIDSRKCAGGALYVPIKGLRFDGHIFIDGARENGAALVLTEHPLEKEPYILVDSALDALQNLAKDYLALFSAPVIGVTGSVGKTSTKEMVYSVLSQKYRMHKNLGNLNNQTGLPQTIFTMDDSFELSIMELGTNHFGEIERLSRMARPDICLFTNIGISHIEHFKTREGILKEKMEMLTHAKPGVKTVVNGDDDLLCRTPGALTYGLGEHNAIRAADVVDLGLEGLSFTAILPEGSFPVRVTAPGKHQVYNALAAIALGTLFDLSVEQMQAGIAACRPQHGRTDVIHTPRFTLIDDTYNAVLASAVTALDLLATAKTRRVAILGDMRELGDQGESLHRQVGAYAAKTQVDLLILAGEYAAAMEAGAKEAGLGCPIFCYPDRDALEAALPQLLKDGDTVLIKASRGLEFEHTVALLESI